MSAADPDEVLTVILTAALCLFDLSITHNFCELVGAAHGAGSG
jgi:hypothetical protein